MDSFLEEQLPNLEYLELSSVELSDKIIVAASKKIKQLVLYGTREYNSEELNSLNEKLGGIPYDSRLAYGRDFPLNMFQKKSDYNS